jgi:hypothetical protein
MAADYDKTRDRMSDEERNGLKGAQVFRKPRDGAQSQTPLFLQRLSRNSGATGAEASEFDSGSPTAMSDGQGGGLNLVVEDSAALVAAGQMKKSEFLERLREAVTAEAAEALSGTLWSAVGCPWIDHWFDYYAAVDVGRIERAVRKYAPSAAGAETADELIPILSGRVRRAIEVWSVTGEMGDAAAEGMGAGPDAGGEVPDLMMKEREGGSRDDADPREVQSRLGEGTTLDGSVRSRMESAYGEDFSDVRVHADAKGAELSTSVDARAFAVGEHIAFGPGEYQPGTPVGDAVIAHELAHVAQQRGAPSTGAPLPKADDANSTLEDDADSAAVGAVVSIWSGMKNGLARISNRAMPRLRSGLRLQRCGGTSRSNTPDKKVAKKGEVVYPTKAEKDPNAGIIGTGPNAGRVEIRKGDEISVRKNAESEFGSIYNLFSLEYSGPRASTAHWVQFYWIEVKDFASLKALKGEVQTVNGLVTLTTDSSKPVWMVDAGGRNPYYEAGGTNIREDGKTTMFDRPGGMDEGAGSAVKKVVDQTDSTIGLAQYVAHLQTYLIQDGVAVFRANWNANTLYSRDSSNVFNGGTTEYEFEGAEAVTGLDPDLAKLIPDEYKAVVK